MPAYKLQKDGVFEIKGYNQAGPFSNFLPGIAGAWGIPVWAFYVNRGQALSSFGLKDKDGAISEFYPANKAYSLVPFFGFRTFIKDSQNNFYEPFSTRQSCNFDNQLMRIDSGYLEIVDSNFDFGLQVTVKYFTLPGEPVGALVRKVIFQNISSRGLELNLADGLAKVIPYGTCNGFLKDMSQTVEAWMHSRLESNLALFRLIVDPADVAQTTYIQGANFNYSLCRLGKKKIQPQLVVDPKKIFGSDLSYLYPFEFAKKSFKPGGPQVLCGKTPAAFSCFNLKMPPGGQAVLYSLFGASPSPEKIKQLTAKASPSFLAQKEKENCRLIQAIKQNSFCLSRSDAFNHYFASSYLDNVMRGGFPYRLTAGQGKQAPFYIFSRKHGDPERDYNYFNLLPSYFSQGQSNYRDLNQNRRMDLFFQPALKSYNLTYFLNLIQADGYNPLLVKGEKFYFNLPEAKKIINRFQIKKKKVLALLLKGFHLGELFQLLEPLPPEVCCQLAAAVLENGQPRQQASHGHGYWVDHWRYNLDLIESYLMVYPDCLKELFFDTEFTFFDDKYRVKPRRLRYLLRKGKVYQGESIEIDREKARILKNRKKFKNTLRSRDKKIYRTNLIEKLLVLILNKAASFDPDGLGIEMEADKPGWCDSLNGLPALFGSSLCETFELKRAVLILKKALSLLQKEPFLLKEKTIKLEKNVYSFFVSLQKLLEADAAYPCGKGNFTYWDKANRIKENFRKNTFFFFSNQKTTLKLKRLEKFLTVLLKKINKAIAASQDKKSRLYPSYFTYRVTEFKKSNHRPWPLQFKRSNFPLFLEGVVHALRSFTPLPLTLAYGDAFSPKPGQAAALYASTKKSPLYDQKLKMYKLNVSLEQEPLEIGRMRAFLPGWLENESIWLHMEYKYLLELLKAGLYRQFYSQFNNCAVCFQDPKVYGRNILENSSFLASSSHPDKSIHGKGFVARLSGATAELINIWLLLSLGQTPFSYTKKGELVFSPRPLLKGELFTEKALEISWQGQKIKVPPHTYSFNLFAKTLVTYHNPRRRDTFLPSCRVKKISLALGNKNLEFNDKVTGKAANLIREQKALRINIYLD